MKNVKFYSVLGFLFVSAAGSIWHFVYGWSRSNPIVALFFPINESTWEHMKLLFFPMLLYSLFWSWKYRKVKRDLLPILCVGILGGTFAIPVLFYTYTGILGFHTLFLDISVFILSVGFAFFLSYRLIENHRKIGRASAIFVVLLAIFFALFTYFPPDIPLFQNPPVS
nr:DUF6512 family protein [uncultured Sellimonas sp.]